MSEPGVHRPQVAGIHGRENEGAYSIVLSGGYDDDQVCEGTTCTCVSIFVCITNDKSLVCVCDSG